MTMDEEFYAQCMEKLRHMNAMDNFMFNELLMQKDKKKAKRFVKTVLEPIIGTPIRELEFVSQMTQQGVTTGNHGIQMDAYVKAYVDANGELQHDVELKLESAIYDIEPNLSQKGQQEDLRRVRYYHSLIDKRILTSGSEYKVLEKVVVIFILPYDPFGRDRMMYTVKRHCVEEPDILYDDGDYTYFLYVYGTKDIPSQELQNMLLFLADSSKENAKNEDLEEVRRMMDEIILDNDAGVKYMLMSEREREMQVDWFQQGLEQGIEQGLEQGQDQITVSLIQTKLSKGKNIFEIAKDLETTEERINELIQKYQIKQTT